MTRIDKRIKKSSNPQSNRRNFIFFKSIIENKFIINVFIPIFILAVSFYLTINKLPLTLLIEDLSKSLEPVIRDVDFKSYFGNDHWNNLLWGTYRPQLYYGMRTRNMNDSLLFGFMWTNSQGTKPLRHFTKTEDHINFQWIYHNGRDFGRQFIHDDNLQSKFETTFIRYINDYGGDWVLKLETQEVKNKLSFLFYLGVDNIKKGHIKAEINNLLDTEEPLKGDFIINGFTPDTKDFSLIFPSNKETDSYYSGTSLREVWRIGENLKIRFSRNDNTRDFYLPNEEDISSNVYTYQRGVSSPNDMFIVFLSNVKERFANKDEKLKYTRQLISNFQKEQELKERKFIEDFNQAFPITLYDEEKIEFGRRLLSNLLGGIGYFTGHFRINHETNNGYILRRSDRPYSLTTATPSRPYFPRGFLWDEGFHQLLISRFDSHLSKDILMHWLNNMQPTGWIPREQILGTESESRVPREFIGQYTDNANPPALMLAFNQLMNYSDLDLRYMEYVYNQLLNHFVWLHSSQKGPRKNTYRWRGSIGNHTLASGLDDYPRAAIRSDKEEHSDLLIWILEYARFLQILGKSLNRKEVSLLHLIEKELVHTLEARYWDSNTQLYCDYDGLEKKHVNHVGYINLFPLMFGIIPKNSSKLLRTLNLLDDYSLLRSDFGIPSLSITDPLFGTQDDYWRGPIWININYLVLRGLYLYYIRDDCIHKDKALAVYNRIRDNLVNNTFNVFKSQKTFFENYDPIKGHGRGQRPFAGWTTLILLIMSEKY